MQNSGKQFELQPCDLLLMNCTDVNECGAVFEVIDKTGALDPADEADTTSQDNPTSERVTNGGTPPLAHGREGLRGKGSPHSLLDTLIAQRATLDGIIQQLVDEDSGTGINQSLTPGIRSGHGFPR